MLPSDVSFCDSAELYLAAAEISPKDWSEVRLVEEPLDVGQLDGDDVERVLVELLLDPHQLQQRAGVPVLPRHL